MLWRGPMGGGAASGRIGAMIASHCAQGQYLKSRVQNTNPRTTLQHPTRNALRQLASMWGQTLTSTQRTGWATYAANTTWVNRLGDTVHLSGQMEFTRSNWLRQYIHLPYVLDAPTIFDRGSTGPGTLTVTAGDDFGVLNVDPAAMWQDGSSLTACMVFMGIPRSGARTFMAKRTQLSATLLGTYGSGLAFPRLVPLTTVAAFNQAFPCWLVATFSDGRLTTATPIAAAFTGAPFTPHWVENFNYSNGSLNGQDGWTSPTFEPNDIQVLGFAANSSTGADSDATVLNDNIVARWDLAWACEFTIRRDNTQTVSNTFQVIFGDPGAPCWQFSINTAPGDVAAQQFFQVNFISYTVGGVSVSNVPADLSQPHLIRLTFDGTTIELFMDGVSLGTDTASAPASTRQVTITKPGGLLDITWNDFDLLGVTEP